MTSSRSRIALTIFQLAATSCAFALECGEFTDPVVHLIVNGEADGDPYSSRGTGFFVDLDGHLITAAHVAAPDEYRAGVDDKPDIKIKVKRSDVADDWTTEAQAVAGVLLYIDKQTDLALIRADHRPTGIFDIGDSSQVVRDSTGCMLALGNDRRRPDVIMIEIKETFSRISNFKGQWELKLLGDKASDSGSPVLNEKGQVIAVFTKGDSAGADQGGAVPINHASPLLGMAGIVHPVSWEKWLDRHDDVSQRVEEVRLFLKEVKRRLVWDTRFDEIPGGRGKTLTISYTKMSSIGMDPVKIVVVYEPWYYVDMDGVVRTHRLDDDNDLPFTNTMTVAPSPPNSGIASDIDIYKLIINRHTVVEPPPDGKKGRLSHVDIYIKPTFQIDCESPASSGFEPECEEASTRYIRVSGDVMSLTENL